MKARARFSIGFKEPMLSPSELSAWEEENDRLDNDFVFQFDGRRNRNYSGAITENNGVQLELISSNTTRK